METLLVLYIASNLVLAGISIPLIREKIRPNFYYGFRVRKTLENPKTWYAVNKFAGQRLLIASLVIILMAIGLYLLPGMTQPVYAFVTLIFFIALTTIALAQSWQFMQSYPEEPKDPRTP